MSNEHTNGLKTMLTHFLLQLAAGCVAVAAYHLVPPQAPGMDSHMALLIGSIFLVIWSATFKGALHTMNVVLLAFAVSFFLLMAMGPSIATIDHDWLRAGAQALLVLITAGGGVWFWSLGPVKMREGNHPIAFWGK